MRKRIGFILVICATLTVVGCGSKPVAIEQTAAKPIVASVPENAPASLPVTKTVSKADKQNVTGLQPPFHVVRSFKGIPILMYHSIAVNPKNTLMVSPANFAAEMEHLKTAGYNTITFEDLNEFLSGGRLLPLKPILITFDDGYKNNYTAAFPILKKLNMKATVFIISDFVGSKNSLSWDEIQEMQDAGVFEIGAHTENHLDLTKISKAEMVEEIAGSKKAIEAHIGKPVISFAYPSGRYNDAVVQETDQAGYEFAVTTRPGLASQSQGLLTLNRVRVAGDESVATFASLLP